MTAQTSDEHKLPSEDSGEMQKLKQELAELKKKNEEYLNAWKRTAADFDNYQKRREKEDQELVVFAKDLVLVKLLPVLDALKQALTQIPTSAEHEAWSKGVEHTAKGLTDALGGLGVEQIKTAGEKFNPELHEAVETITDKGSPGDILEEVAAGYKIDGKVVKPAKVKVAK